MYLSCVQSQTGRGGPPGPPPLDKAPGPPLPTPGGPPPGPGEPQLKLPSGPGGPQPFQPSGPGGPQPQLPSDPPMPQSSGPGKSANPWKDLLTKMMDLLSAGMGPKNISKVPAEIVDPKQGAGPTGVPPPPKPLHLSTPKIVVKDCYYEGKYYMPGSDIVRGQHDRWCYVTYCDSMGKIQFWDDYNCPPNSMRDTSTHSSGSGRDKWQPPGQSAVGGGPAAKKGCDHGGQWYEPNQDISSHRVGDRCYGTYCSADSQVVNWEDWCLNAQSPGPSKSQGPTAGPAPAAGPAQGQRKGVRRGQGQGQGQGRQLGQAQGGRRRARPTMGCYHNGKYYNQNTDVVVGTIGDLCYGYYCEGDNVFVHWEDSCQNQPMIQPAPQPPVQPVQPTNSGWFFK